MRKIAFIGSRGIPANHGGFETFVEELALGLVELGNYEILVVGDCEQKKGNNLDKYKGIALEFSNYSKERRPVKFYKESYKIAAGFSDIIYACGSGNAFNLWIPKLQKKKYITNPDGAGWQRQKWSLEKKIGLYTMFWLTAKMSEYLVCDSYGIQKLFQDEFSRKNNTTVIEYGAHQNKFINVGNDITDAILNEYSLTSNKYHLIISRIEPENNIEMIIRGYLKSESNLEMVIVGNLRENKFVNRILEISKESNKIRFLGGIYDKDKLSVVRANAFSYLHGHSVGGTNPSLLEAMASKNLCICHDNVYNREATSNLSYYFSNENDVRNILNRLENSRAIEIKSIKNALFDKYLEEYTWEKIVSKYNKFFNKLV